MSINPVDPVGAAGIISNETAQMVEGMEYGIFGVSRPDVSGSHGGVVGDVPILGDIGRFGREALGNIAGAGGELLGAVVNTAGGALEHVQPFAGPEWREELQEKWDSIPEDDPIKVAAIEQMKGKPGDIVPPADSHIKAEAVRQYEMQGAPDNPNMWGGLNSTPGSLADTLNNMLGLTGVPSRLVKRNIMDDSRVNEIIDVAEGRRQFDEGTLFKTTKGLNPYEQIVYTKIKNGTWTVDQANDFLVSHFSFSHDPTWEIASEMLFDPTLLPAVALSAGASLGAKSAEIARAIKTADNALDAARLTGVQREIDAAELALRMAREATLKVPGTSRKLNLIGKAQESRAVTDIVKLITQPYVANQGKAFGTAGKVVRVIIDPLHAISLNLPWANADLDVLSDVATPAVVQPHGFHNHLKLIERLSENSPTLRDMFDEDIATYAGNVMRRVIGKRWRSNVMARGMEDDLIGVHPDDVLDIAMEHQKRGIIQMIAIEANRFRVKVWDDIALDNLARRCSTFYGILQPEEWADFVKGINDDMRAMLHAATYGRATKVLLDAIASFPTGSGYRFEDLRESFILINKQTLTKQGAGGIIERLEKAGDDTAGIERIITEAQELYPELLHLTIDKTDWIDTSKKFVKYLQQKMPSMPMQVVDDEAKDLSPAMRELREAIRGEFTLGFKPKDEFLWGLERSDLTGGKYRPVSDVWVGHVADGAKKFQPGRAVRTNVAGVPIVGPMAKIALKPIDLIEAMGRTMTSVVSGTMIAETARTRFMTRAVSDFGEFDLTQSEAQKIWDGIQELVGNQDVITNPRGFTPRALYSAVEEVIPLASRRAGLDRRALMSLILHAYDGDLRQIGITQKLTARTKKVLFEMTGSNIAGQVAEHAWPLMKFRLNIVFQGQEKIEPWILNSQRGASVGIRPTLNAHDVATERLLQKMTDSSLVRMSDLDQGEFSAAIFFNKEMMLRAKQEGTALNKLNGLAAELLDVQGVKRVNMLRTFRKGLGREMKEIYEEFQPGLWDDMKNTEIVKQGGLMSDDDFAVHIITDKLLGNDFMIQRLKEVGGKYAEIPKIFKNSVEAGRWLVPQSLGELKALNLDYVAELTHIPIGRGRRAMNEADLRRALINGDVTIDDVEKALRQVLNADPDYIRRVKNALQFSWTDFWREAEVRFSLDAATSRMLQDYMAASAEMRGCTPIEFVSQIFSPTIADGPEGVYGHLGKVLAAVKGVTPAPLAYIVTHEADGIMGSSEDLIRQLAEIFAAHLDPSAKYALLEKMRPELIAQVKKDNIYLDIAEIEKMFAQNGPSDLAKQIAGFMEPPAIQRRALINSIDDYEKKWGVNSQKVQKYRLQSTGRYFYRNHIGAGVRALAKDDQLRVLRIVDEVRSQFPYIRFDGIDVVDLNKTFGGRQINASAVAIHDDALEHYYVLVDKQTIGPGSEQFWKQQAEGNYRYEQRASTSGRQTPVGTPFSVGEDFESMIYHEFGHTFAFSQRTIMRDLYQVAHQTGATIDELIAKLEPGQEELMLLAKEFEQSEARRWLSEYGYARRPDKYEEHEAFAEWFDLSFNPRHYGRLQWPWGGSSLIKKFDKLGADGNLDPGMDRFMKDGKYAYVYDKPETFKDWSASGTPKMEENTRTGEWGMAWAKNYDDMQAIRHGARWRGSGVLYRTRKNRLTSMYDGLDQSTNYLHGAPRADDVEYLGVDGKWHVLSDAKAEGMHPELAEYVEKLRTLTKRHQMYVPAKPLKREPDVERAAQMFTKWSQHVVKNAMLRGKSSAYGELLDQLGQLPIDEAVPYNLTGEAMMNAVMDDMTWKWQDAFKLQYFAQNRTFLERSINHPVFGIYPASYMWGKIAPEIVRFVMKEPFGVRTGAAAYGMKDVQQAIALQRELDPEFDAKIEQLGHSQALSFLGYMLPALPWETQAGFPIWARQIADQGLDAKRREELGLPQEGIGLVKPITSTLEKLMPYSMTLPWAERGLGELADMRAPEEVASSGTVSATYATDLGPTLQDQFKALQEVLAGQ
jgi:hypothetical protein